MSEVLVQVTRGGVVESRHYGSVAISDASGALLAACGAPEGLTFWRSGAKPFQVLPLVAAGGLEQFGLGEAELAVMVASHSGESAHVDAVRRVLKRVGAREEHLRCGAHLPLYRPAADALVRQGGMARAVHNNCSGKHAAMLALARLNGWPVHGYTEPEHPVQQEMASAVAAVTGIPPSVMHLGVDGCGVPTYYISRQAMAVAYARLVTPGALPEKLAAAAGRVVAAMQGFPHLAGGTGRLNTALMAATGGRVVAKDAAEGLFCVGIPAMNAGLTVKIEDGSQRAVAPLVIEILHRLGVLSDEEIGSLADLHYPVVRNCAGRAVGTIEALLPETLAGALDDLRRRE